MDCGPPPHLEMSKTAGFAAGLQVDQQSLLPLPLFYFISFILLFSFAPAPSLLSSPLIELPFPLERKRWREGEVGLFSVHNPETIFSHLERVFLGSERFSLFLLSSLGDYVYTQMCMGSSAPSMPLLFRAFRSFFPTSFPPSEPLK